MKFTYNKDKELFICSNQGQIIDRDPDLDVLCDRNITPEPTLNLPAQNHAAIGDLTDDDFLLIEVVSDDAHP